MKSVPTQSDGCPSGLKKTLLCNSSGNPQTAMYPKSGSAEYEALEDTGCRFIFSKQGGKNYNIDFNPTPGE